jgi:hypothetical protein
MIQDTKLSIIKLGVDGLCSAAKQDGGGKSYYLTDSSLKPVSQ